MFSWFFPSYPILRSCSFSLLLPLLCYCFILVVTIASILSISTVVHWKLCMCIRNTPHHDTYASNSEMYNFRYLLRIVFYYAQYGANTCIIPDYLNAIEMYVVECIIIAYFSTVQNQLLFASFYKTHLKRSVLCFEGIATHIKYSTCMIFAVE